MLALANMIDSEQGNGQEKKRMRTAGVNATRSRRYGPVSGVIVDEFQVGIVGQGLRQNPRGLLQQIAV
jgi:hypothetical protein